MSLSISGGIMPEQMSYSGFNFDIVSGITAMIVVAVMVLAALCGHPVIFRALALARRRGG